MTADNWGALDDPKVIAARAIWDKDALAEPPADRFDKERWVMASVHAMIFNHVEAVYKNATHVARNDLATYIDVARECFSNLELHHENEETIYFPFFEKHYKMDANRKQHASFLPQVQQTLQYLDAVNPKKPAHVPFSAKKLRELIDSWLPAACEHMADELDTLDGALLRQHLSVAELDQAEAAVMAHNNATLDPFKALPGMLENRPIGCKFPPLPWFVPNVIAPLMALRNWGRWKYYWKEKRWERTSPSPLT